MENIEISVLIQIVKETPNDMELGKKIRRIIKEITENSNGVQQEISK
jgi:hypothetical protein